MTCALLRSERFLEHETGAGHPERADRLRAIHERLEAEGLLSRCPCPDFGPVQAELLDKVHEAEYRRRLARACSWGEPWIDSPECPICPESLEVAELAAGGAVRAVDAVLSHEAQKAFCALRPPGHHAERGRAMGFCLFNNVAIAAERALIAHGLERVAIVDFDVHHGNGTQHHFAARSDVLFVSLHQDPRTLFPGTGMAEERGFGAGEGYTLNLPLPPESGDAAYQRAFEERVGPALEDFAPQLLLASAGFDAAEADPLAQMRVSREGFAWMGRFLKSFADRRCHGRLVSVLEGGYHLEHLAEAAADHLRVLADA